MSDDDERDDEHPGDDTSSGKPPGYKHPPRKGRFKPGKSGTPRGRPKGSRNRLTDFDREMNETVVVRVNGKIRRVRTWTAVLKRLKEMAVKGDMKAINKTIDTAMKLEATAGSEDQGQEILPDADKEILADFLKDNNPDQVMELGPLASRTECDSAICAEGDTGRVRTPLIWTSSGFYRSNIHCA
jgi:hypothetical protein